MILRTSHSGRIPKTDRRRGLRLAFALAITSSCCTAVSAQSPLPSLPSIDLPAASQEAELLPYPFAKSATAQQQQQIASQRLIGLLGMTGSKQNCSKLVVPATATAESLACTGTQLPGCSKPTNCEVSEATLPTQIAPAKITSSAVVLAAATSEELPSPKLAATSDQNDAAESATENATASEVESGSLLDIDIPLIMAGSVASESKSEKPKSEKSEPVKIAIVKPEVSVKTPEAREHTSKDLLRLTDDESAPALSFAADPIRLPSESETRVPQVVKTGKSMSLTVDAPSHRTASQAKSPERTNPDQEKSREVKFSLSDSTSYVEPPQLSSLPAKPLPEKAEMHLGDIETSSSAPKGIQVRIDGERIPLVKSTVDKPSVVRPAAPPAPKFLEEDVPSSHRIPAQLASSVRPIHDSQPLQPGEMMATSGMDHGVLVLDSLQVKVQDSVALTSDAAIVEYSVERPEFCQLLKTGERTVTLVGLRAGTTRIALVTTAQDGQRLVEIHEVAVNGGTDSDVDLRQLVRDISQTVSQLYPDSDVQIQFYKDYLLVRGMASSEADAKKILTLIRKTSLAPVVDQLQSFKR